MSVRRWVAAGAATMLVAGLATAGATPASAVTCPTWVESSQTLSVAPSPGVNWAGCDLSNVILQGANLTGANLTGANLKDSILGDTNLSGANLAGANLFGTTLTNVNLSRANLQKASLVAQLGSVNFTGADLSGANLAGAQMDKNIWGNTNVTGAIFATSNKPGDYAQSCGPAGRVVTLLTKGKPGRLPTGWTWSNGRIRAQQSKCGWTS